MRHAASAGWARTSVADRALLHRIADRIEQNLDAIALAETLDNGKPIRETTAADLPLCVDHSRYFAGCIRAQEGGTSEIDVDTVAYHFHEPLGVVGQIIPWYFPLLMAAGKVAPALAAGNCVVLKPAEQTPMSIMVLTELISDLLPPGVLNVVNGFGVEACKPLASNPRIAKIAFTGETSTDRLIMQYAAENIIPVTLELGGKSPNVFFSDVLAADDAFADKALEGFTMFALNQGEVCTNPSRALVHESIFDEFLERAAARVKNVVAGSPLDPATMIGAQASSEQMEKILSYVDIGKRVRCSDCSWRTPSSARWRVGRRLLRRTNNTVKSVSIPAPDLERARGRLDQQPDAVGQRVSGEPVRLRLGPDQEPGRGLAVGPRQP